MTNFPGLYGEACEPANPFHATNIFAVCLRAIAHAKYLQLVAIEEAGDATLQRSMAAALRQDVLGTEPFWDDDTQALIREYSWLDTVARAAHTAAPASDMPDNVRQALSHAAGWIVGRLSNELGMPPGHPVRARAATLHGLSLRVDLEIEAPRRLG